MILHASALRNFSKFQSKGVLHCLDLSEEIIKELLINGDVNFSESEVHDAKCPVYAIDGSDYPGGELRVFFEQCDSITVLASALYLNNPHNCGCD